MHRRGARIILYIKPKQSHLDVAAPATGLSTGLFYGVGIVFSVSVASILFSDLYRVLSGRMREDELVQVKDSEEQEEFEELQMELAERDRLERVAAAGRSGAGVP